jgi:peptidoglycan/LPS O-acetylase OafA/YrhL
LLLTALVLTYNYGHGDRFQTGRFWRRRFWLVLPAYVTWSAIYYAADGRNLTLTTWSDCLGGSSVTFAVYSAGVHSFPRPPVSNPPASEVTWAWISNTVTVRPAPQA